MKTYWLWCKGRRTISMKRNLCISRKYCICTQEEKKIAQHEHVCPTCVCPISLEVLPSKVFSVCWTCYWPIIVVLQNSSCINPVIVAIIMWWNVAKLAYVVQDSTRSHNLASLLRAESNLAVQDMELSLQITNSTLHQVPC